MHSEAIYLVEIDGIDPLGVVRTLYFASSRYITGPLESPPNTAYAARVLSPGTVRRAMWSRGATRGASEVGYGVLELANADGGLDHLLTWAFDGRAFRVLRGSAGLPRAQFETLLDGTMEQLAVTQQRVVVRIRDRMADLIDKPLVTTLYAGSNVLPAGTEGTAEDLKAKPKPLLLGEQQNFAPPMVNTARLIYQISYRPVAEVVAVYSAGAAITAGVQRATVADLEANTPAAGTYDWTLGNAAEGAFFRLGSNPGQSIITAHAREGVGEANRTAGQVAQRILGMVSSATVEQVAALDAAAPGVVGLWTGTEPVTVGEALDLILGSVGATWTPSRTGTYRLAQLADPENGDAVAATFADIDIVDEGEAIRLTPPGDDGRGVPTYRVEVLYGRNLAPMTGAQVAASVTDARKAWLREEWRTASVSAPAVWNPDTGTGRHPLSRPAQAETALQTEAAALAEAARLLGLYGTPRAFVGVTLRAASVPATVDVGSVVRLRVNRFGFDAGKLLRVTAMDENWGAGTVNLEGWG